MAFKIVGIDENNKFPSRVETRLASDFASKNLTEGSGRLSEPSMDSRYVNEAALDGGAPGQVLTADGIGYGWADSFIASADKRQTDWGLNIDPAVFRAPAGERLNIPTYQKPSGGETTHPDIVYVADGWNGYRYWLAHTPYPGGNDSYENPSIVVSNDGVSWTTPAGLVNPLDTPPAGTYDSDADMLLAPNGSIYLFWRNVNNSAQTETMFMRSSNDGITWTPKKAIHSSTFSERLVSPAFIYEDSGLTMYAIDIASASSRKIVRKRADVANLNSITNSSWSTATTVSLSYIQSGKQPWHLDVKNVDGLYVALITDATIGASGTNGDLFLATSTDGISFTSSNVPLIARSAAGKHDNLYRATLIPEINGNTFGLRIIYGAWQSGSPSVWNLFNTFAMATISPNSTDQSGSFSPIAGRFSAFSQNTLVRRGGVVIASLNGSMAIALNAGSSLINVPVGFRNLTHNTWTWAWNATTNSPVLVYYDRADHTLKMGGNIGATQGIAISMVWDQEG